MPYEIHGESGRRREGGFVQRHCIWKNDDSIPDARRRTRRHSFRYNANALSVDCTFKMGTRLILAAVLLTFLLSPRQGWAQQLFSLRVRQSQLHSGDKVEIVNRTFQRKSTTPQSSTDFVDYSELKGIVEILSWTEASQDGEMEIVVDHLLAGNETVTITLLQPGSHVRLKSISGVKFLTMPGESLSLRVQTALGHTTSIFPQADKDLTWLQLTEPRRIGESWKGNEQAFQPFMPLITRMYPDCEIGMLTTTVHFAGITNLFGAECFDLRSKSACDLPQSFLLQAFPLSSLQSPSIEALHAEVEVTLRYVQPFDRSHPYIHSSGFTIRGSGEVSVGDTNLTFQALFSQESTSQQRLVF